MDLILENKEVRGWRDGRKGRVDFSEWGDEEVTHRHRHGRRSENKI